MLHFLSAYWGSIYQYRLASEAVSYYWATTPSPLLNLAMCHNYHPYPFLLVWFRIKQAGITSF